MENTLNYVSNLTYYIALLKDQGFDNSAKALQEELENRCSDEEVKKHIAKVKRLDLQF